MVSCTERALPLLEPSRKVEKEVLRGEGVYNQRARTRAGTVHSNVSPVRVSRVFFMGRKSGLGDLHLFSSDSVRPGRVPAPTLELDEGLVCPRRPRARQMHLLL